jgi:hypothetical protein
MSWTPAPTVTINGQDFTGRSVGSVSVTRGRDTVYEPPTAGYATLSIIDVQDGGAGFQVGARVTVTVQDSNDDPVTVFTGFLADWTSNVVPASDEPVVVYRLNCVGPLAILNRRSIFFTGRPEEKDGERVAAAIGAGLPVIWGEFSTVRTWDDMGNLTWDTVDPGYDPDLIDPGVYDLTALNVQDSGYTALTVATFAGQSAKGLLFETADGFIGYADADRRPANAAAGFNVIPFGALSAEGVSLSSNLADLTNRITVEYGDEDAVTQEDAFSIGRFGLQETRLSTQLANLTDAEARADDFLFAHSLPTTEFESLRVNLRSDIDAALLDALLTVNSNDAIRVTGLPSKLGFGSQTFRGFVEGLTLSLSEFQANLTLLVSDENLSFGSVLWGQVTATIDWQNVDAALTWADARRVTT